MRPAPDETLLGPAKARAWNDVRPRYGLRETGPNAHRRRQVKVTSFHHVSVNCNDTPLQEMVSFYGDLFGLETKERPEIPGIPGHWFDVADQELHVVGAPPQGTEIDSTGNHFCIAVEDLGEAIAELEERKIPYERRCPGGRHGADLDHRSGREHDRAAAGPGSRALTLTNERIAVF